MHQKKISLHLARHAKPILTTQYYWSSVSDGLILTGRLPIPSSGMGSEGRMSQGKGTIRGTRGCKWKRKRLLFHFPSRSKRSIESLTTTIVFLYIHTPLYQYIEKTERENCGMDLWSALYNGNVQQQWRGFNCCSLGRQYTLQDHTSLAISFGMVEILR